MGTSISQVQKTLTFRFCEERHEQEKKEFATTNQAGIAESRTVKRSPPERPDQTPSHLKCCPVFPTIATDFFVYPNQGA
jgi:hypothetical protein